jgi:hypothetical protein
MTRTRAENIGNPTNDGTADISLSEPYAVRVTLVGVCPLLFHAWSNEAVAEKAAAKKGSAAKKRDNVESYVYRDEKGLLCLPGEYIRQSIIHAAKFRQDPRSPRKSAMDLYKAGVVALTDLCVIDKGKKEWDFLDRRRVIIQRSAITRERPAFRKGWSIDCDIQVLVPEYIGESDLQDVLTNAGRLVGLADFRPTFGRFRVTGFRRLTPSEWAEAAE